MTHDRQLQRLQFDRRSGGQGTHLMQARLSIEQNDIPVNEMSLDDVSDLQVIRHFILIRVHQVSLDSSAQTHWPRCSTLDKVGARIISRSIAHCLSQHLDIMVVNSGWVGQFDSNPFRDCHLVNAKVWIRADDCATGEVNTFSREISSEAPLFPLETLTEASYWLLRQLSWNIGQLGVDICGDRNLYELPMFLGWDLAELSGRRG